MKDRSFDELLQAIQSAIITAQDALKKRHEEKIRQIYKIDKTVSAGTPIFSFNIPQQGAEDKYETLRLPASSFRKYRNAQISSLSLEFECELSEKRFPDASKLYALTIKDNKKRWQRKKFQQMQIIFNGVDEPSGEVRIEGKVLMEIPLYNDKTSNIQEPVGKKQSAFAIGWEILTSMWQPRRFILTAEQTQRARQILK